MIPHRETDIRPGALWGAVPSPPPGWTWDSLMDKALDLARSNLEREEVPVGALVVTAGGRLIGAAANAPLGLHDPTAHAEVLALRAAGSTVGNHRLPGCVLVATLEPCLMCAGALVHARVDGVVYGALDARAGAVVSSLHGLDLPRQEHRPWHMGGVRGQLCADLLRDFFAVRRN
jgi:tRNA(adenine34) deaminase